MSTFDFNHKADTIIIDFTHAHFWDDSAVGAVDRVVLKYKQNNKNVKVAGLNAESRLLVKKLAVYDKPNAKIANH